MTDKIACLFQRSQTEWVVAYGIDDIANVLNAMSYDAALINDPSSGRWKQVDPKSTVAFWMRDGQPAEIGEKGAKVVRMSAEQAAKSFGYGAYLSTEG